MDEDNKKTIIPSENCDSCKIADDYNSEKKKLRKKTMNATIWYLAFVAFVAFVAWIVFCYFGGKRIFEILIAPPNESQHRPPGEIRGAVLPEPGPEPVIEGNMPIVKYEDANETN